MESPVCEIEPAAADKIPSAEIDTQTATTPVQLSLLLSLPEELLRIILQLACAHSAAIIPELWLPGSSKFAHNSVCTSNQWGEYHRDPARVNGRLPEALTAIEVLLTCKDINRIVDGENMFYKLNTFQFSSPMRMINYIKALPTRRRNAITVISTQWEYYKQPEAFIALQSCQNLKYLAVDVTTLGCVFLGPLREFLNSKLFEVSITSGRRCWR